MFTGHFCTSLISIRNCNHSTCKLIYLIKNFSDLNQCNVYNSRNIDMKLKEFEFHSALFLPVYKFSILDIKLKYSAFMLFDWLLLNFKSKLGNNDAFMYIYTFRRKKLQRNIMFTAMAMHLYSASLTHVQIILHSADCAGDEKNYLQFLRCLPSWVQKLF